MIKGGAYHSHTRVFTFATRKSSGRQYDQSELSPPGWRSIAQWPKIPQLPTEWTHAASSLILSKSESNHSLAAASPLSTC